MPSGRDSFRRNRVAPICYDSLLRLATSLLYHPRQMTGGGRDLAATLEYSFAIVFF
jgi:hypothetical protein